VSEAAAPWESAVPAGTTAWDALSACERDEAEAALWQLPETQTTVRYAGAGRGTASRFSTRRFAGRNVRKAYAAARRSRVAAYAAGRRQEQ
jgi:hypothetical protein